MPSQRIDIGLYLPPQPPLGQLKMLAWGARLGRFDTLMLWDHLQDFYPASLWDEDFIWVGRQRSSPHQYYEWRTMLGYLAGRAGGMRLGIGVTEVNRHHPVILAQSMVTLAHLTKRAPILGLGAGERENTEPYGIDMSAPVGRLEEGLQILRHFLDDGSPLDFDGKHFRLEQAIMDLPVPPRRKPAIWVGASGPRMLRLTGTYGDGWYPGFVMSPERYAEGLAAIRQAAREAGRNPGIITPSMQSVVMVVSDERELAGVLGEPAIRLLALTMAAETWREEGLTHPLGEEFRGVMDFMPGKLDRAGWEEALAAATPEIVLRAGIFGTPDEVERRLRDLGEAGLRHIVLIPANALLSMRQTIYGLWSIWNIKRKLG
ncbi:MAG: LLM class flavin-dependent oxidoreductase [Thermomicrobiales bacterium]